MNPLDTILQLGLWAKAHPTEVLLGVGTVPLLAASLGLAARHRRGATTTHGSARWATPGEVRQAGLYATHGVVVGRLRGRVLMDDGDTHILLCAPTGAGKGVGVIIPTLLSWQDSVIVLDPKDGQNADVTSAWRSTVGRVAHFTPCRAPHTCLNVLDTIRLKTLQEFRDAQLIAQSLVAPEKLGRESATALHFRELAALLLTATILHVCYTSAHKSLAGVWAFLTQQHTSLDASLKAMASTAHTSHGVHTAIASMTTAIANIAGDRELSSVWTTAIRPLVLFGDPLVAASTETSTLRFTEYAVWAYAGLAVPHCPVTHGVRALTPALPRGAGCGAGPADGTQGAELAASLAVLCGRITAVWLHAGGR